jgi:hypothetical protein
MTEMDKSVVARHTLKRTEDSAGMLDEYFVTHHADHASVAKHQQAQEIGLAFRQLVRKTQTSIGLDKVLKLRDANGAGLQPHAWEIDYWALNDSQRYSLVLQCMESADIGWSQAGSQLEVAPAALYNFIRKVSGSYGSDQQVPYHNVFHALATVHFAYKIMETTGLQKTLSKIDRFALIIGSLCHDIEHRGRNNAFEVMTHSDVALRYNDASPLENHHCARAFEMAHGGGPKNPEASKMNEEEDCNIFRLIRQEDYKNVRHRMICGILSTDMKNHGDHVKLVTSTDLTQMTSADPFLVEMIMHLADIGNAFMAPKVAAIFGANIAEEFAKQVDEERELGLPVTAFMDGLRTPGVRAKSQMGFVDFVVQPLVAPIFRSFPGLAQAKSFLEENRASTQKKVEQSTAEKAASEETK